MVDVFKTIITMCTQRPGLVANAIRKLTISRLQYLTYSYIGYFTGAVQVYS